MSRKLVIAAFVAAFAGDLYYGARVVKETARHRKEAAPFRDFMAEARRRIPEGAPVLLVAQGSNELFGASQLYPRPVRLGSRSDALRQDPDAWVVVISEPFVPTTSFVGRARDLR